MTGIKAEELTKTEANKTSKRGRQRIFATRALVTEKYGNIRANSFEIEQNRSAVVDITVLPMSENTRTIVLAGLWKANEAMMEKMTKDASWLCYRLSEKLKMLVERGEFEAVSEILGVSLNYFPETEAEARAEDFVSEEEVDEIDEDESAKKIEDEADRKEAAEL